jgi:hypothetical protein
MSGLIRVPAALPVEPAGTRVRWRTRVGAGRGAPIVADSGHLVGVVIAGQDGEGVAVDAHEISALLASADDLTLPEPPGSC